MNFKTTFVLLIFVLIGVFVWVYSGDEAPDADSDADQSVLSTQSKYVFEERPEAREAVQLEFQRMGKPTLKFAREVKKGKSGQMTDWRMIEPLDSAAEGYMIDGLATLLTGLQYSREYAPDEGGVSAAQAGLEPPSAMLKIVDKEDRQFAVEIGKKVALSNDMYVRVVGQKDILVINRDISRDMERKTSEFRAKHMLNFSTADVRNLRMHHDGTTYDIKRVDGEWIATRPIKAYIRTEAFDDMIQALSRLRVAEFAEDEPELLDAYGLTNPLLTVVLKTERTEEVISEQEAPTSQPTLPEYKTIVTQYGLQVGGFADLKSSKRYVKLTNKPWVATVTQTELDKIFPDMDELRDRQVTRVKADDVTGLELTADGVAVTLEKKDGQWSGDETLAELDEEAIDALLQVFEKLQAVDFIDEPAALAEYGLDNPRAVLKVSAADAVEPVTLKIGGATPSGRNAYVQIEGQHSVVVVGAERADELAVEPLALRSREITALQPNQIKQITLQRRDNRYVLKRAPGGPGWQMLEPADAPPENTMVRSLVNDLARLRAKQVVADDADAEYGLDKPAITIEFTVEMPAEGPPADGAAPIGEIVTHVLRVSHIDNQTYARFDDAPYVFMLDKTVYDVFTAEYIRPGLFEIKADDVARLTIAAPGGTLDFLRVGDEWTYPPDPYVKLSQKNVGDFVKEMAELRAAAYMAYRDGDIAQHGLDQAPVVVTIALNDESKITLHIDQVRSGELPRKAAWVEQRRIFLLRQAEAEKLMRGLDYYLQPAAPDAGANNQPPD